MAEKFKSRKFITCILGIIVGLITAISPFVGIDVGDIETTATIISGAITAVASAVVYIRTEGKIDEAAIKLSTQAGKEVTKVIEVVKNSVEDEDKKEVK